MIPIGKRQRPLLEYIVRILRRHGIKDIVLLVGYKYEQILNYFEDGQRFGVKISYVIDEPEFKGTGGALLNAYLKGALDGADTLLVYYGDILSNINLGDLLRKHSEWGSKATLAVATKYQVPVGVVEADDKGRVRSIIEKPWLNILATIGILALEVDTLNVLEKIREKVRGPDIMGHLIPELVNMGMPVYTYKFNGEWYDVGTTERYEKLDNSRIEILFKDLFRET